MRFSQEVKTSSDSCDICISVIILAQLILKGLSDLIIVFSFYYPSDEPWLNKIWYLLNRQPSQSDLFSVNFRVGSSSTPWIQQEGHSCTSYESAHKSILTIFLCDSNENNACRSHLFSQRAEWSLSFPNYVVTYERSSSLLEPSQHHVCPSDFSPLSSHRTSSSCNPSRVPLNSSPSVFLLAP